MGLSDSFCLQLVVWVAGGDLFWYEWGAAVARMLMHAVQWMEKMGL